MLGKTNITTLSEGVVVTEIEDFNWIRMQSGINGNFVKAIYENGYLAAITADGAVAYTTDGEAWQVSNLKYADCKLEDIAWDGSRFLIVGSFKDTVERTDGTSGEYDLGFISMTDDFMSYEYFSADTQGINSANSYDYDSKYVAVYPVNGKMVVLAINMWRGNSASAHSTTLNMLVGGSDNLLKKNDNIVNDARMGDIRVGKNSQGILITSTRTGIVGHIFIINGNTLKNTDKTLSTNNVSMSLLSVFECKDELYYISDKSTNSYRFVKVLSSGEEMIMSTGINYGFVDGTYFNKCKIFINNHEMLILKKEENIADKTLDDLIEIAPENTMTCITNAFGQLFVFGNQGLVLKSSTDGNSEEALLLQTISARKALLDAKSYTDQKYELLEARIAALEAETTREAE